MVSPPRSGSPLLVFGVIVLFVNRVLLGDPSRFVTHGGKGGFRRTARRSWLGVTAIVVYTLASIVLPLGALVIVSLSRFWSGDIDPSTWTLASWREILDAPGVTDAIRNSIVYSIAAVAIVLPLGYIAATFLQRTGEHRIGRPVLDFVVAMPLSIPAAIFGVGFLLTYTREPFVLYGTSWVMILVYITLMIPFSTRMQLSGLAALGTAYVEAARVSGAGPLCGRTSRSSYPCCGRRSGRRGADLRPAHPRVRGLAARPLADDERDGNGALRLLRERRVPDGRRHLTDHGRGDDRRRAARGAPERLRRVPEAVAG